MSKTIKQLADELGVSKQTIRYHIKSLLVNKKAQESSLLKRLDLLEQIYHEQLVSKDQEIARLHDTLDQTQKLLDQSQQLQLMAEKKVTELKKISASSTKKEKDHQKSWWSKLF